MCMQLQLVTMHIMSGGAERAMLAHVATQVCQLHVTDSSVVTYLHLRCTV